MTSPDSPWPGRPAPLGATWDGADLNVALWSGTAEAVDLCLLDEDGGETRLPLTSTAQVWHGCVPGAGPGTRYGFRVDGPYDPSRGQRHNPAKLLLDPYARAMEGGLVLHDAVFGDVTGDGQDHRDSAPYVPTSVVVDGAFDWGEDVPPATPWPHTVVYELHVKGFTKLHPGVPEQLRGTYAGLAHPASVEHLQRLGVTAVELLPVHHYVSEPHLLRKGLTNHWGYNTVGFFAPHAGYSSSGTRGQQVVEFKQMVKDLHAAGLEVILDVVYNHTGEGDEHGPTLAWRGIDNAEHYRLEPGAPAHYRDVTGCGSTFDVRSRRVLATVMDSLRYWVTEMHVDGFRFDLASALLRDGDAVSMQATFLALVHQDPVLSGVKLIAEPWDVGPGGYQVGRFPAPWAEWNDRFRNTVRDVWRGQAQGIRELASRLSGSSDLFQHQGRQPWSSVNFVTAHDGFTLRDLTSYDRKHNEANGEQGRDGDGQNHSWNCGVEGETTDPAVNALRLRQARNLLATLLLSTGVPMLSMGDEVRRTQGGNNNAYCQDSDVSYMPWDLDADAVALCGFVQRLVALRRDHPVLHQSAFFSGFAVDEDGVKDVGWFGLDGQELTPAQWFDPTAVSLGMYVDGRGIRTRGPRGERVVDDSFLVLLHPDPRDTEAVLPGAPWATEYEVVLDTAGDRRDGTTVAAGGVLPLGGRSLVVLRALRPS